MNIWYIHVIDTVSITDEYSRFYIQFSRFLVSLRNDTRYVWCLFEARNYNANYDFRVKWNLPVGCHGNVNWKRRRDVLIEGHGNVIQRRGWDLPLQLH